MAKRNDGKPREAKNVDLSASESSARSQAAESAVTIERLYSAYYLEWIKSGQEFIRKPLTTTIPTVKN